MYLCTYMHTYLPYNVTPFLCIVTARLQVCTGRVIHRTMLSLGLTFNLRQSPSKVRLFIKLILETRPCVDLEVIYDYV